MLAGRHLDIGADWLESSVDVRQWQYFFVHLTEAGIRSNEVRVEMVNVDGDLSDADLYIGVKGKYPTLRSYEKRDVTHSVIDADGNRKNDPVSLSTSVSDNRADLRIGVYGFCCSLNNKFRIKARRISTAPPDSKSEARNPLP